MGEGICHLLYSQPRHHIGRKGIDQTRYLAKP
jgi:hypothetical protein